VAGLTCAQAHNAQLGGPGLSYQGYVTPLQLVGGNWYGNGSHVQLLSCAVGDLDNDGAADVLAAVELTNGGTGQFWTLVFWHNGGGSPIFAAQLDLGDRNPVQDITISGDKATVVWWTRKPADPMYKISIVRTSVYKVSGSTLAEISHTDAPYTGV
jgi:hypothetical protein